ncbi:hypothetical protein [Mesobacillus subterraneus]|uniref:hypothetical protein n=1 Tax=Mesobacillus subterraneus TaxID=285983 RepID=UPI001CFCEC17|nr:hypothetical protein [Mesobacillus subterraneus]
MKLGKWAWLILCIVLIVFLIGYLQQKQQEKYKGLELIPEQTEDIPLYTGLKPESPVYKIKGDYWADIMHFYEKELPKKGWSEVMIQASQNSDEDGAGFISNWEKKGTSWVLSISGGYFQASDQTEVIFEKRKPLKSIKWVETDVTEVCVNEQPDRTDDCFSLTDQQVIKRIIELINSAPEAENQQIYYNEKSVIDFRTFKITVYYDLEKGIYLVSERGTKWMKPEREFFQLTRISKEY